MKGASRNTAPGEQGSLLRSVAPATPGEAAFATGHWFDGLDGSGPRDRQHRAETRLEEAA